MLVRLRPPPPPAPRPGRLCTRSIRGPSRTCGYAGAPPQRAGPPRGGPRRHLPGPAPRSRSSTSSNGNNTLARSRATSGSTPGDTSPACSSIRRVRSRWGCPRVDSREIGRSSAMVSKPRRAEISAGGGDLRRQSVSGPITNDAFTRSGTLSPFVSRTSRPTSKSVVRSRGRFLSGQRHRPEEGPRA